MSGEHQSTIVLMRHGKPEIDDSVCLSAQEFGEWIRYYDEASIDRECPPPPAAIEHATKCSFVVCSNLRRSRESAEILVAERIGYTDRIFREMEMPHGSWRFPRLPVRGWLVLFRLTWILGYSTGVESFKAAKGRARRCAEQLASLASEHGTILFVGHGAINWFIAGYLRENGWRAYGRPKKYWEFAILKLKKDGGYLHDAAGAVSYRNKMGLLDAKTMHEASCVVLQSKFAAVMTTGEWLALLESGQAAPREGLYQSYLNAR